MSKRNIQSEQLMWKLTQDLTEAIHAELAKLGLDNPEALAERLGVYPGDIRHRLELPGYVWPLIPCLDAIAKLDLPIRIVVQRDEEGSGEG